MSPRNKWGLGGWDWSGGMTGPCRQILVGLNTYSLLIITFCWGGWPFRGWHNPSISNFTHKNFFSIVFSIFLLPAAPHVIQKPYFPLYFQYFCLLWACKTPLNGSPTAYWSEYRLRRHYLERPSPQKWCCDPTRFLEFRWSLHLS